MFVHLEVDISCPLLYLHLLGVPTPTLSSSARIISRNMRCLTVYEKSAKTALSLSFSGSRQRLCAARECQQMLQAVQACNSWEAQVCAWSSEVHLIRLCSYGAA